MGCIALLWLLLAGAPARADAPLPVLDAIALDLAEQRVRPFGAKAGPHPIEAPTGVRALRTGPWTRGPTGLVPRDQLAGVIQRPCELRPEVVTARMVALVFNVERRVRGDGVALVTILPLSRDMMLRLPDRGQPEVMPRCPE